MSTSLNAPTADWQHDAKSRQRLGRFCDRFSAPCIRQRLEWLRNCCCAGRNDLWRLLGVPFICHFIRQRLKLDLLHNCRCAGRSDLWRLLGAPFRPPLHPQKKAEAGLVAQLPVRWLQ